MKITIKVEQVNRYWRATANGIFIEAPTKTEAVNRWLSILRPKYEVHLHIVDPQKKVTPCKSFIPVQLVQV